MLREREPHGQGAVGREQLGRDPHRRVLRCTEAVGVVARVEAHAAGDAALAEHRQEVARAGSQLGHGGPDEVVVGDQPVGELLGERLERRREVQGVLVGRVVVHQRLVERAVVEMSAAATDDEVDVATRDRFGLLRTHLRVDQHRQVRQRQHVAALRRHRRGRSATPVGQVAMRVQERHHSASSSVSTPSSTSCAPISSV